MNEHEDSPSPIIRVPTLASLITLVLVLCPIVQNHREEPIDGFPLSYFPMFTNVREGRTTVTHPIAIFADGTTKDVHYQFAGSGGMNQVRRQITRQVRDGKGRQLCEEVARRVAASNDYADVVAVEIVRDRFLFDDFLGGNRAPIERETLARVELEPEAAP